MTARLLLLLSSLVLTLPAQAQRRAVMENLATTGTSIFISSTVTRVGIGTSAPAQALDVRGNIVGNSSVTASAFFGDGSALTGFDTLASSRTTGGFATLSQTAFGPAVSTITITTSGQEVACWFSGGAYSSSDNRDIALNILEDGAYVSPYTSAAGITSGYVNTGGNSRPRNMSFYKVFRAPSAGSHSYALTPLTSTSGDFVFDTTFSKPEFGCMEK